MGLNIFYDIFVKTKNVMINFIGKYYKQIIYWIFLIINYVIGVVLLQQLLILILPNNNIGFYKIAFLNMVIGILNSIPRTEDEKLKKIEEYIAHTVTCIIYKILLLVVIFFINFLTN